MSLPAAQPIEFCGNGYAHAGGGHRHNGTRRHVEVVFMRVLSSSFDLNGGVSLVETTESPFSRSNFNVIEIHLLLPRLIGRVN